MNVHPNNRPGSGTQPISAPLALQDAGGSSRHAWGRVIPALAEQFDVFAGRRTVLVVSLSVLFWFGMFFNPAGIWITDVLGAGA